MTESKVMNQPTHIHLTVRSIAVQRGHKVQNMKMETL